MKDDGVCDDASQARNRFRFLEKLDNKYIIILEPIWRSGQSERGGFRYHKHGPYIGTQNPQHEYLYDDKYIDSVFLFNVSEIVEKGEPDFKGHEFIIEKMRYLIRMKKWLLSIAKKKVRWFVATMKKMKHL